MAARAGGGDRLFAEACLARAAKLELYIPFDEQTFFCWSGRSTLPMRAGASVSTQRRAVPRCMSCPTNLVHFQRGEDPYKRNNLWMLKSAKRFGWDKVAFITLWNGQGGDGPGGTKHLMDEVRRKTDRVYWLDTRQLWG